MNIRFHRRIASPLFTLLLAGACPLLFAADFVALPLAEKIAVGGRVIDLKSPPAGLVVRESLGLLTASAIDGQIVHRTATRVLETRAILTPKGDYLLLFPEGEHYATAKGRPKVNSMIAYRSTDKGRTWQGPTTAFDIDYSQHGFIPLIPRGTQRLYAFGTQPVPGQYTDANGQRENAPIGFRWSDDDGRTWSKVKLIAPVNDPGFRGMSLMRMTETDAGTWLVGSHTADWSVKPFTTRQYLLRSEDRGETWTLLPGPRPKGWFAAGFNRMDEGRPLNLGGGRVFFMSRTPEGHLWSARSADDGKTWSAPAPTPLTHPDAPPMLFPLSDGKTLVAFHHDRTGMIDNRSGPRSEIWCATSTDEGQTWSEPRFVFANALQPNLKSISFNHQASYLDVFTDGGVLNIVFPHRWQQVHYLKLKESALSTLPTRAELGGTSVSSLSGITGDPKNVIEADLCIYGGTSGGVVAAAQASRLGKSVVIVEPGRHLGGMTAGGLSWTDVGNSDRVGAIGGLAREVYERIGSHYGQKPGATFDAPAVPADRALGVDFAKPPSLAFEPHVAEAMFMALAKESRARVFFGQPLVSVQREGTRIREIVTSSGTTFRARMFIDATYEGDLMAEAGVSFTVGREANAQYGETVNGIQLPAQSGRSGRFEVPVDPYQTPGRSASGVLPYLLQSASLGTVGAADERVQSYNFRVCLTNDPGNRVTLQPPPHYREANYELLARWTEARVAAGETLTLRSYLKYDPLQNRKFDFNNRWAISTDFLGGADAYPRASREERVKIARAHEDYLRGFFHFLATSKRVPPAVREEMGRFGLCRDEFTDNGGWPHQLYVREARRMVGSFVMTEHEVRGPRIAEQTIGLGTYGIDMHAVRRLVVDGRPANEGSNGGAVPRPYPIAYGAIVPKAAECENLFVTFCVSATHVAFGSIRMEPVFMTLSQVAATAASLAIDGNSSAQAVHYPTLRSRLLADHVVLDWPPSAPVQNSK